MTWLLVAVGAAVAVAVELLEALAIVLAVGATRRWRDAILGATAGVVACALLAAAIGPALSAIDIDVLRLVIGTLLLLYGLEWLRKGTLRLAGRRARASSAAEYAGTVQELDDDPLPPPGRPDWAGRLVAFKGVLLEGVEIVIIVAALAARPGGASAALAGAASATLLVVGAAVWLRRPLSRIPETELKWGVGVMLSAFGLFFAGEGLHVDWPGNDAAVLYLVATFAFVTQLQIRALSRDGAPA
jgi:uncharacterized membrane protein